MKSGLVKNSGMLFSYDVEFTKIFELLKNSSFTEIQIFAILKQQMSFNLLFVFSIR